ncbi:hypothetical protein TWF173_004392 [Orbilia oligospora]|nr:hypothetical protein TWF173_004392 [Orbilia oligospora]
MPQRNFCNTSAQANPNYYGPPGGAPPGAYPGQAPPGQYPPSGPGGPGGPPPPQGGQKAGAPGAYQAPQYQAYSGGSGSKPPGGPGGPAPYGQTPMSPSSYGYNQPPPPYPGAPAIPPRPGAMPGGMHNPSPYGGGYQSTPPPQQQYNPYGGSSPNPPYQGSPFGQSNPYAPVQQYGQPQQQMPPYNNPYGGPSQQTYGQPHTPQPSYYAPQGQQPMGGPAGGPGQVNPQQYMQVLQQTVVDNKIQSFFPPQRLEQISRTISNQIDRLRQGWNLPLEVAVDFVKLALFDIIIYIDDSGSMAFEEGGERIKDLKLILERVAFAATLFDHDGISLRFMNNDLARNNITQPQEIEQIISQVQFKGLTPMGTSLKSKVLDPLVLAPARSNGLQKPILVITITDGQPAGEPESAVQDAVKSTSDELARTQYGAGAVSFQFAQVGNDLRAREFLGRLDRDPRIGHLIDCTSNYEVEADEMSKSSPPVNLTVELWLTKLLLGAVDPSYDRKDEAGHAPPPQQGGYGGPQGYGAPPPQQYGAPQGQYGGPQGQYGAPPPGQYGAPPPGQYGGQQQQYGAPQGQYGAPPPGQYGAPPPGQYGGGYPGGKPPKY